MPIIPAKQFPHALSDAPSFLTIQKTWEEEPVRRPQIAAGLKHMCRTMNAVVSVVRLQP